MKTTYELETITAYATIIDADGYIQSNGVVVCDLGETITIGDTEHLKDDLVIENHKITSIHGWAVTW